MHNKFIVFEGGEGSGKTDKSTFVFEQLRADGIDVIRTREPGGSPYGEKIRALIFDKDDGSKADAETMFGLFWAARRDHMQNLIIPALKRGAVVICDRFDASTYSYQIGGQQQSQLKKLFWEMRDHYVGEFTPRLYIFCNAPVRTALARAKSRVGEVTHFDERDVEFHNRVHAGYMEFFRSDHGIPHTTIDTSVALEDARQEALKIIRALIK